MRTGGWFWGVAIGVWGCVALRAPGVELVRDGAARATIWIADQGDRPREGDAWESARVLADYIKRMTGATLPVMQAGKNGHPKDDEPAIIIGKLALDMGLSAPPATTRGDGYRIRARGQRVLLAGETPKSTFFAVSDLLEHFGCRWFINNSIGTVVPTLASLDTGKLDIEEKPSFAIRIMRGSSGNAVNPSLNMTLWARHNRMTSLALPTKHDWPSWFCTQDPAARAAYLSNVVARVRGKGVFSTSITPPEGKEYCRCAKCLALDDASNANPNSGVPVMSDRLQEFYNYLGREVKKVNPSAILYHYAFEDYLWPPRRRTDIPDNLCVLVSCKSFCRLHGLSNESCATRQGCRSLVSGWAKVESKMVWRDYNYNIDEATVPMSKVSTWAADIPWLFHQGCTGLDIECMSLPHLYGPHTYLAARLAWNAKADAAAIMDDFYAKFCGPAAANVKAYWERIDKAYRATDAHASGFYATHRFWTPALLTACRADLDAAARAAGSNELYAARVAMFRMGLENAQYYHDWLDAVNQCDFAKSQGIYDAWMGHMYNVYEAKIHPVDKYRFGYVPEYLGVGQAAGYAHVVDGATKIQQCPDEWEFRYDRDNAGEAAGWYKTETGSEGWRRVRTYTSTLGDQGVPNEAAGMWYRVKIRTPKTLPDGRQILWFMQLDADAVRVWVDGKPVGEETAIKVFQPVDVDVTGSIRPDAEHLIVAKLHHRKPSAPTLGGILRPVMLCSGNKAGQQ